MKRIICCLLVAVMLSACGKKQIGDIVMTNGNMGIVYAVSSDGQHGMAVSVTQEDGNWEAAKQWCAQYGRDWRLPSRDELVVIYRKRDVLNPILEANGYDELSGCYWSSTEEDEYSAWRVRMIDGYTDDSYKNDLNYVRAVSAF